MEARGHPTDRNRNPVAETVRHYRSTAVYLVVAVTVILGLALWEEVFDPPPPYCGPQAADIEGEHA